MNDNIDDLQLQEFSNSEDEVTKSFLLLLVSIILQEEILLKRKKKIEWEEAQRRRTWWQKFVDKLPDADDVLAYHTQQELNVLDRRLGYIFYIALIGIALYVVVFVRLYQKLSFVQNFGIKKKYLVSNFKQGIVNLKSLGTAHSINNN